MQKGAIYQVGCETGGTGIADSLLSWLGLLLTANNGNKRDVDLEEVFLSGTTAQLSHGLNKGPRFNITDSSSQLDDADIRLLAGLIDGDLGDTLDPILNRVGQVRNNLHSLTQVIASSLFEISQQFPNRSKKALTSRSITCW